MIIYWGTGKFLIHKLYCPTNDTRYANRRESKIRIMFMYFHWTILRYFYYFPAVFSTAYSTDLHCSTPLLVSFTYFGIHNTGSYKIKTKCKFKENGSCLLKSLLKSGDLAE